MMLNNQALGLFLVRILLGATFIMHGSQKVLGWFSGPGLTQFVGYVTSMGFPSWMGYAAAYSELIGGLLLLFGIFPRLGALLIIPVMLVAIVKIHWINGYFAQNGGYEYALCLLVLALVILIAGGGSYHLYDDSYWMESIIFYKK